MDLDSEPKLRSLISQITSLKGTTELDPKPESKLKFISLVLQIISLVSSIDLDLQPKPESKLMSLVTQAISVFSSMDLDSQPESLTRLIWLISLISRKNSFIKSPDSEFMSLVDELENLEPKPELVSLIGQVLSLFVSLDSELEAKPSDFDSDSESESKLIFLITKLLSHQLTKYIAEPEGILVTFQIVSLIVSMDLESQPKPESEFMWLVTQGISVFNSMDLDSQPKQLRELISIISQETPLDINSADLDSEFYLLVRRTLRIEPEPELISLIYKIFSLVFAMNPKWEKLVSFSPRKELRLKQEEKSWREVSSRSTNKWECLPGYWTEISSTGKDVTHFFCNGCYGQNHEEYDKAPFEVKHSLHPRHSLHMFLLWDYHTGFVCYSCNQDLEGTIYYCPACNLAICIACAEKKPLLSINHPKWHEHKLALFPSLASFTCNICALKHSRCPFYICPPCDFVAHQSCISLPRVIRISRHLHRISFTPSFRKGDWSCGVCRTKVDSDYGAYSCIKDSCLYVVHSICATQKNIWDGVDLEGEPEEIEEEVLEPFVRISDGIIRHFSHEHHHLRLDDNTDRDYKDNKLCQACITQIYYGNFYYCLQCDDFILHETCANLPRTTYHPLHPHLLTLVTKNSGVISTQTTCSACPWLCTGFFYECTQCSKKQSKFKVHVRCATVSEPLVHESHVHPLFLTSKPGEKRTCGACNDSRRACKSVKRCTDETFNCIECDFALCFGCATVPQKVRYKHDKHMLTLSYGEESSTMKSWCEICEREVNLKERFYKCEEYCCVTLHIECLVENDLYMKPGLSLTYYDSDHAKVVPNHGTSRPFCSDCGHGKRCQYKYFYMFRTAVYCSPSEAFSAIFSDHLDRNPSKGY